MTELEAIFKKAGLSSEPMQANEPTTKTASKSTGILAEITSLTAALNKLAEDEGSVPPEGAVPPEAAAAAAQDPQVQALLQEAAQISGQNPEAEGAVPQGAPQEGEMTAEEILAALGQEGNPDAQKEVTAALKVSKPITITFDKTSALDFVINKYAAQNYFQGVAAKAEKAQHEKTAAGCTEEELDEFAKNAFWQGLSEVVEKDRQEKTAAFSQLNEIARYAPDLATALYTKMANEQLSQEGPAVSGDAISAEREKQVAEKTVAVTPEMVKGDDELNEQNVKQREAAESTGAVSGANLDKMSQLINLQTKISALLAAEAKKTRK